MSIRSTALGSLATAATLAILLAGCSSSSAPPVPPDVTPDEIQGVATPSSVAVVTATNAQ